MQFPTNGQPLRANKFTPLTPVYSIVPLSAVAWQYQNFALLMFLELLSLFVGCHIMTTFTCEIVRSRNRATSKFQVLVIYAIYKHLYGQVATGCKIRPAIQSTSGDKINRMSETEGSRDCRYQPCLVEMDCMA